jgi:hypothetical protein
MRSKLEEVRGRGIELEEGMSVEKKKFNKN